MGGVTKPGRKLRAMAFLAILSLLAAACGSGGEAETDPTESESAEETEAAEEELELGTHSVAVGGGPAGGVSYNISAAMGEIVRTGSENLTPTIEEVTIVQTNMTRLASGELQLGFNTTYDAHQATTGEGPFNGEKVEGINFVMGGSIGGFGFVVPKSSGITSLEELCGQTMAVGSETARAILSSLLVPSGIDPECIKWDHGISYDQIVVGFQDGTYKAAGFVGIPQSSSLLQLLETLEVTFLSPDPSLVDKIAEEYPFFPAQVVEADTLKQQTEDWVVGGFLQGIWSHENVPEDLVYQWVKTVFEGMDECVKIQEGCAAYTAETTAEWINEGLTIVPPHPGTVRYLEEIGLEVNFPG